MSSSFLSVVSIESVAFPGVYIRMDYMSDSGVPLIAPAPDGGGTVNLQRTVGPRETFNLLRSAYYPDVVSFNSIAYTNLYLRMAVSEDPVAIGTGVVNCQYAPPGGTEYFTLKYNNDGTWYILNKAPPLIGFLCADASSLPATAPNGGGRVYWSPSGGNNALFKLHFSELIQSYALSITFPPSVTPVSNYFFTNNHSYQVTSNPKPTRAPMLYSGLIDASTQWTGGLPPSDAGFLMWNIAPGCNTFSLSNIPADSGLAQLAFTLPGNGPPGQPNNSDIALSVRNGVRTVILNGLEYPEGKPQTIGPYTYYPTYNELGTVALTIRDATVVKHSVLVTLGEGISAVMQEIGGQSAFGYCQLVILGPQQAFPETNGLDPVQWASTPPLDLSSGYRLTGNSFGFLDFDDSAFLAMAFEIQMGGSPPVGCSCQVEPSTGTYLISVGGSAIPFNATVTAAKLYSVNCTVSNGTISITINRAPPTNMQSALATAAPPAAPSPSEAPGSAASGCCAIQ